MPEKPAIPRGPIATPSTKPPATDASSKAKGKGKDEHRDSPREIAETVVFVVVLVLMLKTFVAEAFVIPTGSMAETLYGYHKMVTCDKCGFVFPLNCHNEVENNIPALDAVCPNCQHQIHWSSADQGPTWSSGDRVLVAKFLYDNNHLWSPKRHEVIVFKYPGEEHGDTIEGGPQKANSAMNYIKRCEGLEEETIAIYGGDLYVTKSLHYPPPQGDPKNFWLKANMHIDDPDAVALFHQSITRRIQNRGTPDDFEIIRKTPGMILDVRRPVYDNDHQAKDLTNKIDQRWRMSDQAGWSGDDATFPKTFTHAAGEAKEQWLEYHHLLRESARNSAIANPRGFESDPRRLISNALGYNSGGADQNAMWNRWVGDLMLDCTVKVTDPQGEFVLELAKGIDRFQARFDLASGDCTLVRLTGKLGNQMEKQELAKKPTNLKKSGSYHVRFANFDERLTVWVDRELPFGDGVAYSPATEEGPIGENDLTPARVGANKAGVAVSHLQLWRDIYYTIPPTLPEGNKEVLTMYVQKGHFLALGDNSSSSSDSRYWGLVPRRLLLGRALAVYFPFWPFDQRAGFIR